MFTTPVWRYLPRLVLGPRVASELTVGTAWHEYQPPTDKEKSFKLLDAFVAAGGNFFDTANGYSVSISSLQVKQRLTDRTKKVRLSLVNGWLNVGIGID